MSLKFWMRLQLDDSFDVVTFFTRRILNIGREIYKPKCFYRYVDVSNWATYD